MTSLGRELFLAGAVPFLVLGTAHALATPLDPTDSKGLSPHDPAVATYAAQAAAFLPLAVAVAAVYTLLAARYWFQVPLLGCPASLACLLGAWVARLAGH